MKKQLLAMVILLLCSFYVFPSQSVSAAAASEMYVNAKNDIHLREKADPNAKKVGTIKNHSKVTVLASSNGFSYVIAGQVKGYVYTSALSNKITKPAPTVVTRGLAPVDGLTLTYYPSFLDSKRETFYVEKDDEFTYLYNKKSPLYPDLSNFTYIENPYGMMMGVSSSDFIFINSPYPLEQGTYFTQSDYYDDEYVLVESTTKTITVKAGTFRNVVILRFWDGSREYLAKGIGIIKSTNSIGEVITELESVKVRK